MRGLLFALAIVLISGFAFGQDPNRPRHPNEYIEPGAMVFDLPGMPRNMVFLGDSNTYAGRYVAIADAKLRAVFGDNMLRVLNLGVSSETASGLSEPDHPFKRPCVHSRIDKLLRMLKPSLVVVCYGMNDGAYQPITEESIETYQHEMLRLTKKIRATGASLLVMTPPPFEADAIRKQGKKFGPNANGNFAWNAPAESYDDVVKKMSEWCLTNPFDAFAVVDLRKPLLELKASKTQEDADFLLTGDGVHFHDEAHAAVANALMKAMPMGDLLVETTVTAEQLSVSIQCNALLRDAYLSAVGKNRPSLKPGLPVFSALQKAAALRATIDVAAEPLRIDD